MQKNNLSALARFYDQLLIDFNEETGVMWCYMNPYPRPCFTPQLLNDLRRFLQFIRNKVSSDVRSDGSSDIKYIVFGSYKPGVFSLGGDLSLFTECINSSDKNRLTDYMHLSIEVMYSIYSNMDVPLTTISLIRGNALGAGFEGALSCDYIVAEKNVQLGFPEVLFNMFPGMGAYSFLARRLDSARVERMILNGRIYSAEELFDMKLIDALSEDGHGEQEIEVFIKKLEKSKNTRKAILEIRKRVHPITLQEMLDVGEIWVNSAMALSRHEIKVMQRLVRAQDRMAKSLSAVTAVELSKDKVKV